MVEGNHMSIFVHNEFREVPWDFIKRPKLTPQFWSVSSQKLVDFVALGTIDFNLLEEWKFGSFFFIKTINILWSTRLLTLESVTRESKDL